MLDSIVLAMSIICVHLQIAFLYVFYENGKY